MNLIKIKEFDFENLLDDYNDIIKRCHIIEKVSNSVSFIPNTKITIYDNKLIYKQDLIKKKLN